jgi:hypothetical protein
MTLILRYRGFDYVSYHNGAYENADSIAAPLCIGTEFDHLTGPAYLPYWSDIIASVRGVFSGSLTYSTDWNDDVSPWQGHNGLPAGTGNIATQISFWDQPSASTAMRRSRTRANPSLADLVAGWTMVPTDSDAKAVIGDQSLIGY